MVRLIQKKLRGSILEPLIALMIILFSLTAAFAVVISASQRNNMKQYVRAEALADHILHSSMAEKDFISEEINNEGLLIEKEIEWFDPGNSLLKIGVLVYDNKERLLIKRQTVIIYNEDDKH